MNRYKKDYTRYEGLEGWEKKTYDFVKLLIVDGEDTDTERLMNIRGLPRQLPETDCYSTAVLLLSGGTTGVPKLIPRTHTDYIYSARMSAARCRLDEDSIYLDTPIPYMGSARLYKAERINEMIPEQPGVTARFWNDICLGGVRTITVPGNHFTCIEEPENAANLADLILSVH